MHSLEFVWTVPNDDNRVADGMELREEFLNGRRRRLNPEGVSILEVLIALSRRLEFQADGDADVWAWKLIKNLRLNKMSDPVSENDAERIDDILDTLVWRTYRRNGEGGFFPLRSSLEDQTKVEVWYQMHAYIREMQT
jgi:hypothetical protein